LACPCPARRLPCRASGTAGQVAACLLKSTELALSLPATPPAPFSGTGLNAAELTRQKARSTPLAEANAGDSIRPEDLLELPVVYLIPAGAGRSDHRDNAPRIKAKLVLEAANGRRRQRRMPSCRCRRLVVPDIVANAGGVVVSYFEWAQNLCYMRWPELEVNSACMKLSPRLQRGFRLAQSGKGHAQDSGVDDRVGRVVEAVKLAGSTRRGQPPAKLGPSCPVVPSRPSGRRRCRGRGAAFHDGPDDERLAAGSCRGREAPGTFVICWLRASRWPQLSDLHPSCSSMSARVRGSHRQEIRSTSSSNRCRISFISMRPLPGMNSTRTPCSFSSTPFSPVSSGQNGIVASPPSSGGGAR